MAKLLYHPQHHPASDDEDNRLRLRRALGFKAGDKIDIAKLPFTPEDTTAGTENELQTAVIGCSDKVDLPLIIKESDFYANLHKRVSSGDMPRSRLTALEEFLEENPNQVWENSWVRFPLSYLSPYTLNILKRDLLHDKKRPSGPERQDIGRFTFRRESATWLRIPVSYLFKLALAEVINNPDLPNSLIEIGQTCLEHFLNDNTSPETFSFHPSRATEGRTLGQNVAAEMSKRFAYTQMLLQFANRVFRLTAHGQKAIVYFASNPPVRQNELNNLIPDNFYRELFMSPCLSGWDQGEAKHRYMSMCHEVLSRSQLNAMKKLRDAGIITTNLVVMPNTSNISLANNGTHLSLGSRKLTALLAEQNPDFSQSQEKWAGDLAIKISEHFLPLFVASYTAAPYRHAFADFHPEKVLGFLPHELDFTHLRMIWRRWKKKANLKVFGQPLTPFGPEWLDQLLSKVLGLKGDFVPDKRLVDYLVSLMSTDQSPALNGTLNNDKKLLQDLENQGVFDASMSLYLLYKLRRQSEIGFSGFEGRFYSLFYDLIDDFSQAADLQMLISALAYKYILEGTVTHHDIPDTPSTESERRQIFFSTAIGLPTFFVRKESANRFLQKIIKHTKGVRSSARYPGYYRLYNLEFRKALISLLREEAAELIVLMDLEDNLNKLEERLVNPKHRSAEGRLTRGILKNSGAQTALQLDSRDFNQAAESYYHHGLRRQHYDQALSLLGQDLNELDKSALTDATLRNAMHAILPEKISAGDFFQRYRQAILEDSVELDSLQIVLQLTTLSIGQDQGRFYDSLANSESRDLYVAPVH